MKTCIITGVSGAIGSTAAESLRSKGYRVISIGRSRPVNVQVDHLAFDLSTTLSEALIREEVAKLTDSVWAVVHVAGCGVTGKLTDFKVDDYQSLMQINAWSPAIITKALLPFMIDGGRIVSVSSVISNGKAARGAYCASKSALEALTRCWALELADQRITANIVAPGPTESKMLRSVLPKDSEIEKAALDGIPSKRFSTPEDTASAISYFLDDGSSNTTGQTIRIDGGLSVK